MVRRVVRNPEAGTGALEYIGNSDRVRDPNPDPIRIDEVFSTFPRRRAWGVLSNGTIFDVRLKNIFKTDLAAMAHMHHKNRRARKPEDFLGPKPSYVFCLEWIDDPLCGRVKCGHEFFWHSGGCGIHKGVYHKNGNNDVYRLWEEGLPMPGRYFMDPLEVERIEKEEEGQRLEREAEEKTAEDNEALNARAEEEGIPPYFLFEQRKRDAHNDLVRRGKPNAKQSQSSEETPIEEPKTSEGKKERRIKALKRFDKKAKRK